MIINTYLGILSDDLLSAIELIVSFETYFDEESFNEEYRKKLISKFKQIETKTLYVLHAKSSYLIKDILETLLLEDRLELKRLWNELKKADRAKKGALLEAFIIKLFNLEPGLEVADKNFKTKNEEIDILLKNKVDDPFWVQLISPFIFVECKNWNSKVETEDIKKLKSNLDDHRSQARVGILMSVNGFSKGADIVKVRSGSQDKIICTIDGKDIEHFLDAKTSLKFFLEEIIKQTIR